MEEKKRFTFRRIRGRIVPIRIKDKNIQGAGAIAAGIGIGAATAEAAKYLVTKSAEIRIRARRDFKLASALTKAVQRSPEQLTLGLESQVAKDFAGKLAMKRYGSNLLYKARGPLLLAGGVLASSLISTGISKLRENKKNPQDPSEKAIQDLAVDAATTLGIGSLYYKRLGVGKMAQAIKFAIMRARKIPRPVKIPIKTIQETLRF